MATERGVRVVVADDHAGLRRSLRLLLEREAGMEVVAEASDFEATIRQVAAQRPDVLVLDLHMPDGSNAGRMQRVKSRSSDTGIVVVSMQDSSMFADQALKAGALGFVLADRADEELPDAVRRAALGEVYRSPRLRGC